MFDLKKSLEIFIRNIYYIMENYTEEFKQNMLMEINLLQNGGESEPDIDSEIEEEINKILENIKHNDDDYESLSDIEEIRLMAINKVFDSYMVYEPNIKNKEQALKELSNYKFIDLNDLKKGDYVRYFNLRNFFDLKLTRGGTILDLNNIDNGEILICAPNGVKKIKANMFFMRIKTEELIRMKLIQIAHTI